MTTMSEEQRGRRLDMGSGSMAGVKANRHGMNAMTTQQGRTRLDMVMNQELT